MVHFPAQDLCGDSRPRLSNRASLGRRRSVQQFNCTALSRTAGVPRTHSRNACSPTVKSIAPTEPMSQLTEADVRRLLDPAQLISALELAFRDRYPSITIPARTIAPLSSGVFLAMSCYDASGH